MSVQQARSESGVAVLGAVLMILGGGLIFLFLAIMVAVAAGWIA